MVQLSEEQLNNLGKEALVIIVASLQDQLAALQSQLDVANAQLSDNNRQISLFDSFNEAEYLQRNVPAEPEISEVVIPSYRRSKATGKREADLEGLPSRVFEHKLSEEELALKFPNGYK